MRVLAVLPCQGYSEELLLHGLVRVLGVDTSKMDYVVDYPRLDLTWDKPQPGGPGTIYTALSGILHGEPEPDRTNIGDRIRNGGFDVIIVSNRAAKFLPADMYDKVPSFLLDGEDDAERLMATEVNLVQPRLYFKRELYIADSFFRPHPFSYLERRVLAPCLPRKHRLTGLFSVDHYPRERALQFFPPSEYNTQILPQTMSLPNIAYVSALRESYVGLDIRGYGWTALRRWEIPAAGAILMTHQLPILIPHDFEEGVECVYMRDFTAAKKFADEMPDDVYMEMAGRAHEKLITYHTTMVRAQQMLTDIEGAL